MHAAEFLLIAGFVLLYGLISKRLARTPLSSPILAVVYGLALGPLGLRWLHLEIEGGAVQLFAELTLALVLFHDAARIDLRLLAKNLGTPGRLLGPGLLGTVVLGWAIGLLLLGDMLTALEIALLAALLAPTDAALGQEVVTHESVPVRIRQGLNVESGLNDGLIVPVVAILLACAAGNDSLGPYEWVTEGAKAAGLGVGVGAALGLILAKLLDAAEARRWMERGARRIAMAMVPVLAFFGAEAAGGSGFLAAFVSGLAVGSTTHYLERDLFDFTEDIGQFLGLVTWIGFGVAAGPMALECAEPVVIFYALASLTVIRMVPVALALLGAGYSRDTVLFLGWFGPRGLASVVFAIGVLGDNGIAGRDTLFGVAVWTVLLSVLLHGVTAARLARAYGQRCATLALGAGAPELAEVQSHPSPRELLP